MSDFRASTSRHLAASFLSCPLLPWDCQVRKFMASLGREFLETALNSLSFIQQTFRNMYKERLLSQEISLCFHEEDSSPGVRPINNAMTDCNECQGNSRVGTITESDCRRVELECCFGLSVHRKGSSCLKHFSWIQTNEKGPVRWRPWVVEFQGDEKQE